MNKFIINSILVLMIIFSNSCASFISALQESKKVSEEFSEISRKTIKDDFEPSFEKNNFQLKIKLESKKIYEVQKIKTEVFRNEHQTSWTMLTLGLFVVPSLLFGVNTHQGILLISAGLLSGIILSIGDAIIVNNLPVNEKKVQTGEKKSEFLNENVIIKNALVTLKLNNKDYYSVSDLNGVAVFENITVDSSSDIEITAKTNDGITYSKKVKF